jgi:transposase
MLPSTIERGVHRRVGALEWAAIRALADDGVSQREIARRLQVNRRTVARKFSAETPPPRYARRPAGSQLDSMMATFRGALADRPDIKAPQLTVLLRSAHGYGGSVDLVRRRLALLRDERGVGSRAGPRPGGEVQFDWAEMPTRPWIGGVRRSVYALVALLPFSGAQTAHFSFDATLESFLEGNVRVFDWLGGVPRDCFYDNLPEIIAKRDGRQALRWNKRFRGLRSHYAFRSAAYMAGEMGEADVGRVAAEVAKKGPREDGEAMADGTAVGAVRTTLEDSSLARAVDRLKSDFWPTSRFARLVELDALYAAWRDGLGHARLNAADGAFAAERLVEERQALRMLPYSDFDFSVRRSVRVPLDGYVRYGASFYGAPARLVKGCVDLHASRDEVWISSEGLRVAGYTRSYRAGKWLPARPR